MSRTRQTGSAQRRARRVMLERKSYGMKGGTSTMHVGEGYRSLIEQEQQVINGALFNRVQPHVGVYHLGLPAQSSAPKGAYVINRGLGNARFAVEMARWDKKEGRIYLGMFDPNK